MHIQPYTLAIPQAALDDLRERLRRTRWPQQLAGVGWSRGVPLDYLQQLAAYWASDYDWRAWEARLNVLPQFTAVVDGQQLHFVQARSSEARALPLLLCHGYPGSVVDFLPVLDRLTNPGAHGGDPADAFHVIALSLPGLGLSPAVTETGWNLMRTAHAAAGLMRELGYARYAAQAGDAGAGLVGMLGGMYPGTLVGIHLNGPAPFPEPTAEGLAALAQAPDLSPQDRVRLERMRAFAREGSGYLHIQSTRPSTLGYGLHDSPAMQLAWIVEKYYEWTDPAKALPEDAIDRDLMLTNVSVYWFSGNGAGGANFIYENMYPAAEVAWSDGGDSSWSEASGADAAPKLPTGVAVFAADNTIRRLIDPDEQLAHYAEYDRGGHFPAMEVPELYIDDVRAFFRHLR